MKCVLEPVSPTVRHFHADYRFAAALLGLLRPVQRHRALCAGWPQKDAPGPVARESVAAAVSAALTACGADRAALEGDRQAFLEAFRLRWESLLASSWRESREMLFLRHCRLIEGLLHQLAGVADAWPQLDRERNYLLSVYARQLPELAECLGQLRGLGCGVAAAAECTPFKRTRLLFLCSSAQALLGAAFQRYHGIAPPAEARVARTATERLVHVLRAEFLRERVEYPVADFYRLATESIDTLFGWIEASGAELVAPLTARRRSVR